VENEAIVSEDEATVTENGATRLRMKLGVAEDEAGRRPQRCEGVFDEANVAQNEAKVPRMRRASQRTKRRRGERSERHGERSEGVADESNARPMNVGGGRG